MTIISRATCIALGVITAICLPMDAQTGATSTKITVTGVRGIAEALDHLQQVFLKPITYEQIPLESPTKRQREVPKRLLADPVTAFTPLPGASGSPYLVAQSVLGAYRNAAEPGVYGVYKVVLQTNRVDVVPAQVLGADGSLRDVTPIMSRSISFPAAKRFLPDTVQLIAEALSAESGFKIGLVGLEGFLLEQVELGANGESAADVIEKVGASLNRKISFRCTFDPGARTYYLALKGLPPPPVSGGPPVQDRIENLPNRSPNSRFFVKAR
jgi:hypothetical protein